jgi:hypothetical protein
MKTTAPKRAIKERMWSGFFWRINMGSFVEERRWILGFGLKQRKG